MFELFSIFDFDNSGFIDIGEELLGMSILEELEESDGEKHGMTTMIFWSGGYIKNQRLI